jgi:hypothetical protein
MIDLYCERTGPGLLAEPINTVTNVVFVLAGIAAWNLAERRRVGDAGLRVLFVLAMAVGLGSAIWHLFATAWAKPLDLIPILAFQLWFLWLYLRRGARLSVGVVAVVVAGYLGVSLLMLRLPPYLNGSILYAPTFAVMLGLAWYHDATAQPGRHLMEAGLALFVVALTFRSIDNQVCGTIPIGTHFLWHCFNGGLFYVVMRVLILNRTTPSVPSA